MEFKLIPTEAKIEELRKHMIEFIDGHPGAIKQELVDYCDVKGYGSRKTISRELKLLHTNKEIHIIIDKANSQRHKLYVNSDSEVYKLRKSLDELRDAFFKLVEEFKAKEKTGILANTDIERIKNLDFSVDEQDKIAPAYDLMLAHQSLVILLQHVLGMYVLYFLFKWPQEITEPETLNKLHSMTFQTITEIRNEISRSLPDYSVFTFQDDLVNRMFVLNPFRLCAAFINLKTHGVAEQTETVVDALWKFSTPFVPSDFAQFRWFIEEDGKEKRLAKSWRKVVNLIDDQLDGAWKIERDEFKDKYLYDSLPP